MLVETVAARIDSDCPGMAIEDSGFADTRSALQSPESSNVSYWCLVTVEVDATVPVLGKAGSNDAAWRIDVSCWTLANNTMNCKAQLPFGK